jgi:hypothetical protein
MNHGKGKQQPKHHQAAAVKVARVKAELVQVCG